MLTALLFGVPYLRRERPAALEHYGPPPGAGRAPRPPGGRGWAGAPCPANTASAIARAIERSA